MESHPLKKGLRQTEQRKAVFEALMSNADHPSAVDVFIRVKNRMPTISLATVYNCLETLTDNGLVRAVNHEREPPRQLLARQGHRAREDRRRGQAAQLCDPEVRARAAD